MNHSVQETLEHLVQLNQLEEQLEVSRKSKDESLSYQALIESLRSNFLPSILQQHDRLRAKGKRSVAEVRHGVCSGCHMSIPVGVLALLQHRDQIQKCTQCGRYIFLPEDEPLPLAHKLPSAKTVATRSRPQQIR